MSRMRMRAMLWLPRKERGMVRYLTQNLPLFELGLKETPTLWTFENAGYKDLVLSIPISNKGELEHSLELMTRLNEVYFIDNPRAPGLYESGVRYAYEPEGEENWLTVPILYRYGLGDCEDLATALAAEYRQRQRIGAIAHPSQKGNVWHIRTKNQQTGQIEDPSKVLGMGSI